MRQIFRFRQILFNALTLFAISFALSLRAWAGGDKLDSLRGKSLTWKYSTMAILDSAQLRVMYDYAYIPDSSNRKKVLHTKMILLVGEHYSMFMEYSTFQRDSVMRALLQQKHKPNAARLTERALDFPVPRIDYAFIRSKRRDFHGYPCCVEYSAHSNTSSHSICTYEPSPVWEMVKHERAIWGFPCRKAIGGICNRETTVWYTENVQLDAGPGIFHGLPGLVVQVEEVAKLHSFNYIDLQKTSGYSPIYCADSARVSSFHSTFRTLRLVFLKDGVVFTEADFAPWGRAYVQK